VNFYRKFEILEETKNLPEAENLPILDPKPQESHNDSTILPICNLSDDSNEKFIKKLLKKLKNSKGSDKDNSQGEGEYKFSNFLDNYYEKNVSLLQNLMKYMKNSDKESEGFTKLLAKRSAEYDISNSLKYLDESIFNKRKKLKKMKGKKDLYLDSLARYNTQNPFFKKENLMDSLKLENQQQNAFNPFFNQNKMLTNFPNNSQAFTQRNNNNMPQNYQNDMFQFGNFGGNMKQENQNNLLNSPFLEPGLSRNNSINCAELGEEFQNNGYQSPANFNFESPMRNNNNINGNNNMGNNADQIFNPYLSNNQLGRSMNLKDEVEDFLN